MKYSDIMTEDAPAKNIHDLVSNIALSLISSGKSEFSTKGLSSEIKKRTGIDVPYGAMMNILSELPFVQSVTADSIVLSNSESSTPQGQPTNAETVEDMAVKSAVKLNQEK